MNTILSLLAENNVKRIIVEKEDVVDTKVVVMCYTERAVDKHPKIW